MMVIVAVLDLYHHGVISGYRIAMAGIRFGILTVLEAGTEQIDNLILPIAGVVLFAY